jgi:hypothetical protein
VAAENGYCAATVTGTHTASENALPTAPTIQKPADVCYNSGALVFTATGYTGVLQWTATGGGTQSGSSVTFASGAATGTKTVTARSAQSYSSALTCYSATVTQSAAVNPLPVVSSVSGNSRCDAGAVTLSATMSGDVTTAMTYTWTVGGSSYTTTTDSYTTVSLSSSAAYTVKAINVNNCESNTASGNITVTFPAGDGQTANSCGCATGTINCSGTCITTGYYTQNDGACTGECNKAYVRRFDQCGNVVNAQYSTYTKSSCTTGCCTPAGSGQPVGDCGCASGLQNCSGTCRSTCGAVWSADCTRGAWGWVIAAGRGNTFHEAQVTCASIDPITYCGEKGFAYYGSYLDDNDKSFGCGCCN